MNDSGHATIEQIAIVIFVLLIAIRYSKANYKIYLRPIVGAEKIRYAVARAAEQGKAISFSTGITTLGPVFYGCMSILSTVTKKAARLRVPLLVPQNSPEALTLVETCLQQAYQEANASSRYSSTQIRFLSEEQFAFAAGYGGLVHRENIGVAFLFGSFAGESLILAEAGKQVGAYQIAASVSPEQVPFFICTCDHTLIGEEFFSVSAYLSDDNDTKASLKIQDILRGLVISILILGSIINTVLHFI